MMEKTEYQRKAETKKAKEPDAISYGRHENAEAARAVM